MIGDELTQIGFDRRLVLRRRKPCGQNRAGVVISYRWYSSRVRSVAAQPTPARRSCSGCSYWSMIRNASPIAYSRSSSRRKNATMLKWLLTTGPRPTSRASSWMSDGSRSKLFAYRRAGGRGTADARRGEQRAAPSSAVLAPRQRAPRVPTCSTSSPRFETMRPSLKVRRDVQRDETPVLRQVGEVETGAPPDQATQ